MTRLEQQNQAPLTVRQEDSVTDVVDAAVALHKHAEDVFMAAVWLIAKDPMCGDVMTDMPDRRLVYLRPNRVAQSPGLLVRYKIETDGVPAIDWIKYYEYDEPDAVTPAAYIHKR